MAVAPENLDWETIGRLEEVFENVARAVVAGQVGLDALQPPHAATDLVDPLDLVYSIPRVSVDLEFSLEITANRRVLLKRHREVTALRHHLRFAFLAGPRRPPPPPRVYAQEILQPSFFLPGGEQEALRASLAAHLRRPGSWSFRPRPAKDGKRRFRKEVEAEGERVATSDAMVFFRLPAGRVLAVRVAGGSTGKKDGLFVVDPAADVPVAIFNFQGDGEGGIRWEPLGLLAASLRQWLAAGRPHERAELTLGRGFEGPRAFVDGLLTGLGRGQRYLSRPPEREEPLPVFYDLGGVEARLHFAVSEDDPEARLERADVAARAGGTDHVPASILRIAVDPRADPARLILELVELEFVLAGDDRRRAIDQLVAEAEHVDAVMGGGGVRRWIEDSARQERAVVLRWFHETERLLAIWPAARGEELAFTGERRGARIRSLEPVKAAGAMPSLVDDEDADVLHYAPFHRFFQAVLAWQRRGV